MIRVCHVITLLELGGAQQNTIYTCSKLDSSRFDVTLIAGKGGYLDGDARRLLGGRVTFVPQLVREVRPARDLRAFLALTRLFRSRHPDIVHTHSSKAGILGRAAAWAAGVPAVVHSIHGFPFNDYQSWPVRRGYLLAEKLAAKWTDRFIAVSRRNAEQGVTLGIFDADSVRLIRSGFDIEAFAKAPRLAEKRREMGVPAGVPLVGTVACLKPQKAPLDFVDVCARVAHSKRDAHFIMVGDGELRAAVESRVRDAKLTDRFHLLGWREDVADILSQLSIFVLTSRWEGLPRAVLQARAASLPVVATAVDGTVEVIEDGINGYLCPAGDIPAMAARVTELLSDPARTRAMGGRAREGLHEFDQDGMVREQERLYDELAQRKC
ncbi:MAG: glycosyltransferase family 4 protein [Acidobacteria bacterium]|nr:glycosyltransferase family 4 protein [Acidobacteriota bacterium]